MTTDIEKLAASFWTEVEKVIEETPTARFEALVASSPLTPEDSAELRAAVDANRAAQREMTRQRLCDCIGGSTHGTDDPRWRGCDLCGGLIATDPVTGQFVERDDG